MKITKKLNILNLSSYVFNGMINILDVVNISWLMILKDVKMGQYYIIYVILMKLMFYILLLIISNVFFKKVTYIVI